VPLSWRPPPSARPDSNISASISATNRSTGPTDRRQPSFAQHPTPPCNNDGDSSAALQGATQHRLPAALPSEMTAAIATVHRALYGKPPAPLQSVDQAQQLVNMMRREIGLPESQHTSMNGLVQAIQDTAVAVGC
jgi:hypothetical protein